MLAEKIAIISGKGDLPKLLAEAVSAEGKELVVIVISQGEEILWIRHFHHYVLHIGAMSELIRILRENNVKEVVFAGSVVRPSFREIKLDSLGMTVIGRIAKSRLKGDDNVLTVVSNFIEEQGFKMVGAHMILEGLQVKPGVLGFIQVDKEAISDIDLSKIILEELGKFDIGQAIVINEGRVIAIEAAEGTDGMLERVKKLGNKGGILAKFRKPQQNTKVDLPTIGIETIKKAKEAGLKGIVIGADSVLILNKNEVIKLANELEIFIKAI